MIKYRSVKLNTSLIFQPAIFAVKITSRFHRCIIISSEKLCLQCWMGSSNILLRCGLMLTTFLPFFVCSGDNWIFFFSPVSLFSLSGEERNQKNRKTEKRKTKKKTSSAYTDQSLCARKLNRNRYKKGKERERKIENKAQRYSQ